MSFNELIENVKAWSVARELDTASPIKQTQKLNEEWGELNAGKAKADQDKLKDSVGDVLVVLTIMAQQMQFDKIERLINPELTGFGHYTKNDVSTDLLLLYGTKEIGLIASKWIEMFYNPGVINTRTQIQFHIRNLTGILHKLAINEGTDIETCFELAWNEIKSRQGEMVNGVFVKQEDLEDVGR